MPSESDRSRERARSAPADELKSLVHSSSEKVLLGLLENRQVQETHILLLLERLNLPVSVLNAIAAQSKWMASEGVRFGLASHPHTPKPIALAASRHLYLLDLVRLSLRPAAAADVKRIVEEIILARLPHLPVGQKLTLARRGPARVAGAILGEGHAQVIKIALNNPLLAESQILKVLAKDGVPERVVAAIAQHRKWSCRYNVRMALVRNPHTPLPCLLAFLSQLNRNDLREIARTSELAVHLRKYIERELARTPGHEESESG